MKIRKLKIRNFKCFGDAEFSLDDHLNVLVGDNGHGKTAALEAISVALGSFLIGLPKIRSRGIHQSEVRQVHVATKGSALSTNNHFPVCIECDGSAFGTELNWKRELTSFEKRTTWRECQDLIDLTRNVWKTIKEDSTDLEREALPVLAYYGTRRLWRETISYSESKGKDDALACYRLALSRDREQVFMKWDEAFAKEPVFVKALKHVLKKCVPGVQNAFISDSNGNKKGGGRFYVLFETGENVCSEDLSDGYRIMTLMLADLVYRMYRLNIHLGANFLRDTTGVVLIDEIDLYLHPSWQRQVVTELGNAFPGIQFVTTTHSPQILVGCGAGQVTVMHRSGDGILFERSQVPLGYRADQVLTGHWFGLPTTLDHATERMLHDHRRFLAMRDFDRARRLESRLRERLGRFSDTSLEGWAHSIAAELFSEMKLTDAHLELVRDDIRRRLENRES